MKTKLLSIMSLIVVAMKTKVLILSTIIALIGVLSVNAQETQNNESVEYTINYTKELLQKSDNKILLPKEVNYLLGCGDSDNIYLVPEWEDAYIEKGGNNILTYIVPLKGEANNVEIVAELNVVRETFSYHRMVTSHFKLSNDSTVENISIISNIYGDLSGVEIYDNNMNLKDAVTINSNGISTAIDMSRLKRNYNKSKFNHSTKSKLPSLSVILRNDSYRYNTNATKYTDMNPSER